MTLNIDNINFEAKLPDIPQSLPVVRCVAPDFGSRVSRVKELAKWGIRTVCQDSP